MYLTRMKLDTSKRKTICALSSPAMFHGAVEESTAEKGGKLWRVDSLNDDRFLIVVSYDYPNLEHVEEQFGVDGSCNTLDYSFFLSKINNGDYRRFRLKANPVISKCLGPGIRGKIVSHLTPEYQAKWLIDRAEKNGFKIEQSGFSVVESKWESFQKKSDGGCRVTFNTATFEGVLTVTDANIFRSVLQNGIGREKAYGCGLLTVTRCIK